MCGFVGGLVGGTFLGEGVGGFGEERLINFF